MEGTPGNSNLLFNSTEDKKYLCEYRHDGSLWAIEINATSYEEAQERLKSISKGRILGEIKATVPKQISLLAKLVVFVGNLIRQRN